MTTRELQEYWRNEKGCWKPVKLLFEVASARIEERKVSKFVVGTASSPTRAGSPFRASAFPAMEWVHTLYLAEYFCGKVKKQDFMLSMVLGAVRTGDV